MTCFNNIFII